MSNVIRGLRAVSLLRVSTDKQTNEDNDIPGQRQLNQDFINRQGLILVREFVEGGISGFKTKMANRDAIIQIELMAERKEFDVLVVYKSDRIGRTSDESPMIVKRLNDKNIRIFTANNEEIKTNTQIDKLMTYLTFWQNESESVKLSERVADYHKILIHEGKYRGGTVPFGYMIVDNGTKNYKGRHIYDFVVNPQEAEIVNLIYNLAIKGNMGSRSIAKYLNENGNLKSNGNGWAFNTITNILNNPIYKGYFLVQSKVKKEEIISPKVEELAIIDEDTWDICQRSRRNRKMDINTTIIKGSTRGNALLAGIAYCGHCDSKMHIWNNHKYYIKRDGIKSKVVVINYRCQSSVSSGRIKCDGQKTYSSKKIDGFIEDEIAEYIMLLQSTNIYDQLQLDLEKQYKQIVKEKQKLSQKFEEKEKQITTLKKEIPNAILGNGVFSVEDLKESINLIQKDFDLIQKEMLEIDIKIEKAQLELNEAKSVNLNIGGWIDKFKNSDLIIKKSMLSDVVEKAIIFKDNVEVKWKMNWDTFKEKIG